jgi:hypothetical protein
MSQNEPRLVVHYGEESAFPNPYSLFYNVTLTGEPRATEEDPLVLLIEEREILQRKIYY